MDTAIHIDGEQSIISKAEKVAIDLNALKMSLRLLTDRYVIAKEAAIDYNEVIAAVAEKSGLKPAVIKAFIAARYKETTVEKKELADQLSLLCEEIG
jgi:hypothetical protein